MQYQAGYKAGPAKPRAGVTRLIILTLTFCSVVMLAAACGAPSYLSNLPDMIPASYYSCLDVSPKVILDAYYNQYGGRYLAEAQYNGQPFIFKNIEVTQSMIEGQGTDYIWVDRVKCTLATDFSRYIKEGKLVDIVGTMQGIPIDPDTPYSILMTDCYVIPAGSVALPLAGGATFAPAY